jgi:HEPN domain-containing protein
MDPDDHINYWIESARHDLDTAETLFASEKFDWCLFLGHLVVEKALKAVYVAEHEYDLPPRTHNLVRLMQESSLDFDEETILWLDRVNDFHIEARYPDFKRAFHKLCTREFARWHLTRIKETFAWLTSHLKSDRL